MEIWTVLKYNIADKCSGGNQIIIGFKYAMTEYCGIL
jgi:hypothetical protein